MAIDIKFPKSLANSFVTTIGGLSIPVFSRYSLIFITAYTTEFGETVFAIFNKYFLQIWIQKITDNLYGTFDEVKSGK